MKRKIKIVKQPTYESGGMHTGDQANYGLYRGGGQLQDYLTGPEDSSEKDVRVTYPEVDREGATAEVEKGEYIVAKDMTALYKVGGKKHSEGGTPVFVAGGEYVVSDYITMPDGLQDLLGFEGKSKKKKDNTIAKLLGDKVDAKEYNRLSKIIQDDLSGKDVDQFELATARNRMPLYQEFISKAALGGEIAKAMQGKQYEIPAIAQIAMEKLQTPSRLNEVEQQPLVSAKQGGTLLPKFQDGRVKESEVDKYVGMGYIYDPTKKTLTKPNASIVTVVPGTTLPGTPITSIQRRPSNITYEDVIANPTLYPSFLNKSGWSKAPESEAREAWKTWWTTKQRPVYVPGSSTITSGGESVLQVVPDDTFDGSITGKKNIIITERTAKPINITSATVTPKVPNSIRITGVGTKTEDEAESSSVSDNTNGNAIQKLQDQVQKKDASDQGIDWQPGWSSGRQPWWAQNKLQTSALLYDYLNKQDIYPWEPTLTPVFPQAVFSSPRQAIAAIQSMAAEERRGAAMFAGPQRYSAISSSINAQTIPNVTNVIRDVNEANRQAAMMTNAQAAEIANRFNVALAERGRRLFDNTTRTRAQSRQEDRLKFAALLQQGIVPGMTEAQRTSWLNAINERFGIDPSTGTIYFKRGKDLDSDIETGQTTESDIAMINRLKGMGISADEAIKYVLEKNKATRTSNRNADMLANYINRGGNSRTR